MSRMTFAFAGLAFISLAGPVSAKVSDQDAQKLKTVLTPWGAERAGNKEGTIPAWTGGFSQPPAGVNPNGVMPDFFAGDAKLLTIDAGNVDRYADKLSTGVIYMIKNYKGYHIDIYPTHRTAVAPQWYYDKTFYNATHAELQDNNWLAGVVGGIPFPIPQNGKELSWNINVTWKGTQTHALTGFYIVAPNSAPQQTSEASQNYLYPYNDPSVTLADYNGYDLMSRVDTVGPPSRVGEANLSWTSTDQRKHDLEIWQYLVGQRRLRKAPNITYDGTYPDCGGMVSVDELAIWLGAPDRYDFKIIGKKELYLPYNNNKVFHDTSTSLLGPLYLNPDDVRWELHRVWVVDLDLAPGKHHLIPHRRIYVDEDTWAPLLGDDYDARGTLWKVAEGLTYMNPFIPTAVLNSQVTYETRGAGYCAATMVTTDHPREFPLLPIRPPYSASYWQPATLAAESAR